MGVPVVLPSNTPERMRTVSLSRRCVVYCEVPGRRRSTSFCRSASVSTSPGGQPSTTQPRAAPWLSPKLVTVNTRPNVFPATRLSLLQVGRPQYEHSAAAHRDLRPDERQSRERPHERPLRVSDLHDQEALLSEIPRCRGKDGPHRIEAVIPGSQGDARL